MSSIVLELGGLRGRRGLPGMASERHRLSHRPALRLFLLLLLRHRRLSCGALISYGGSPRNRSGAQASYQRSRVLDLSNRSSTCLGSPGGSRIGMRCRASAPCPINESHEAAAIASG